MTRADRYIAVQGTAYLEFGSPEPAALKRLLVQVGFVGMAQHRRFDIELYRQGHVDIIVNAHPQSHAMAFAAGHGPSCAGMAFLVDDADAAAVTATQRGACRLADTPPSLLPEHTIEGIGGSALYLLDSKLRDELYSEFVFSRASPIEPIAPFVRVDHVTHCVRRGEMAKWVEFYKHLFGFEEVFKFVAGEQKDGFDTVAVRDPGSNACVTVLEPLGEASQIQEFIDEYNGEGIQHIAFLSEDLYRTVERLRSRGVEFLPTPPSYYDALDERLPGHGEDVGRLRSLGMLIDGAANGENPDRSARLLLQVFTRKLIGPIFFEAIQRKGNSGFGEGNAKALFEAIKREQGGGTTRGH